MNTRVAEYDNSSVWFLAMGLLFICFLAFTKDIPEPVSRLGSGPQTLEWKGEGVGLFKSSRGTFKLATISRSDLVIGATYEVKAGPVMTRWGGRHFYLTPIRS